VIKIMNVDIEHIPDEQCHPTRQFPEGRYPTIDIAISTGSMIFDPVEKHETWEHIIGKTCACGKGHVTYGTWRTPVEGMVFADKEALMHYLMMDDEYPRRRGLEAINQTKYAEWGIDRKY